MSELFERFKNVPGRSFAPRAAKSVIEFAAQDRRMNNLAHDPELQEEHTRASAITALHGRILKSRDIVDAARIDNEKIDWYSMDRKSLAFILDTAIRAGLNELGVRPYEADLPVAINRIDFDQHVNAMKLNQE